ncbi:divalent-cation tolerance protein CutA [Saccharothrix algeriensis]|uniref:Divalent-cation tolerance protein CutA n=1 Tax=Saccharothrix algeriensis TaxID=173560 RepID=A0A8T8HZJ7_9PSEU|nr:divalent-cation tolerance protein CutA [Saccharothrix algeriensis]MBM7809527.1 periplasmic divalent cation tolerance protein [Saccharothrix algeriensis]QTR03848.1 divalent-cation tolerance protein CutA [Saccharothrix algeriensis]
MDDNHVVVITTTDSEEAAAALARSVVEARLAACVQIGPPVRSVYRWDGALREDREWQLWIKTAYDRLDELTGFVRAAHSYDTPEVLALPVLGGDPDYLAWVTAETR